MSDGPLFRKIDCLAIRVTDLDAAVDFYAGLGQAVAPAVERFVAAGGDVIVPPFDIAIGKCAVVSDPWDNHLVLLDNSKGRFVTDDAGNVTGVDPI